MALNSYNMNSKAQVIFYTLMLGTLVIVLALALAKPTKQFIEQTRSDMDCSNSSISIYDQATCVAWDLNLPLLIGGMLLIGIITIGAKLISGG